MARQAKFEIVGDASGVKKSTQEAVAHISKMDAAVAGFVGGAALKGFNLLTDAVKGLADQVGASGDIFREDQVSATLLAQAMKDNIPNWNGNTTAAEGLVKRLGELGFQADEVRNALGQLVGVTHNEKKANQDLNTAVEFARAHHLSLAEAVDIVSKAEAGNVRALKTYGITVATATDHVDALRAAHHKYTPAQLAAAQAADKAETAQRALDAMLKQTKGSAEAYADTAQGKLEAANVKNHESWVRIGSIVNRIQSVVLPLVAAAFERVSNFVVDHVVPAFNQIWAAAQQIWGAFTALLAPAIDYIRDNFDSIKPVLVGLAIVVGVVFGLIVLAVLAVIAVVVVLVAAIVWFVKKNEENITNGLAAWGRLLDFIKGLPGKIGSAAHGMWDGIWQAFRGMINQIIHAWNSLKFTVPAFDFLGQHTPALSLSVPQIPSFQHGGTLPYTGLFYGHAGEEITPAGRSGRGSEIHLHIGTLIGADGPGMDRLAREILTRARFAPGT